MDIPVFKKVAIPIAVPNGVPKIFPYARYITRRPGGDGAIREIIDIGFRILNEEARTTTPTNILYL